jgi:methylphosphotriester-DNA--protein-cysteine methyltransferase
MKAAAATADESGHEAGPAALDHWHAVLCRERNADGIFFYGVVTTGVYCRPSCPSRRPKRENVRFFSSHGMAASAGFRPCKRCRPDQDRRDGEDRS